MAESPEAEGLIASKSLSSAHALPVGFGEAPR
jgi:hypothetical protein